MNSQSVTQILLSLKTLVGEEAFQQSLSALSAVPEKSSAFGVPKQWAKTVKQTADRLNALPEAATASAEALPQAATASGDALPKKKGGRPTKAEAEAKLAAMTPEERAQAEAKKADAKAKRDAKKAEASSDSASVTPSGNASETETKKAGRPKMTAEQKAEAKAKRDAKKAQAAQPSTEVAQPSAEPSGLQGEWAEMAEALVEVQSN